MHPLIDRLLRDQPANIPVERDAWPAIVEHVLAQRLVGVAYPQMASCCPAPLAERLREAYLRAAATQALCARQLRLILDACRRKAVDCIPLRGLALLQAIYGDDRVIRPMGDVDLLVRREGLDRLDAILRAGGHRLVDRRPGFAREFSYTNEWSAGDASGVVVEPHWTLAYPPFVGRLDMTGVWGRAVPGELLGMPTRLLCREDLLLNLCLHLAHRGPSSPLLWIYELGRLLRSAHGEIDWTRWLDQVNRAGAGRAAGWSLEAARCVTGAPVPDEVIARCREHAASGAAARVVERAGIDGRESFAALWTIRGFGAKCRYASALAFPSREFMRVRYGLPDGAPLWRHYARRAWGVARDAARGGLSSLIGNSGSRSA